MSELIKHECGIALIRLLKPLQYYQEKYGTWRYAINKLYLLMEKQHNRGQDGAGVVNIKLDLPPGHPYIYRHRSNQREPIRQVFDNIHSDLGKYNDRCDKKAIDGEEAYQKLPFTGEIYIGHLRYGTFGGNSIDTVHPVIRSNNWKSRSLVLAGNFNLTNVDVLYQGLLDIGQHPVDYSDTVTILERMGYSLEEEVDVLYKKFRDEGHEKMEISSMIADRIELRNVLTNSSEKWDGGYVIAGTTGQGNAFVMRDPTGIRPAFWYSDDEIVVAASERPVIQTVFHLVADQVKEVPPGEALIIRRNGKVTVEKVREALERKSCSFERIYFSRGSDESIYQERKMLGKLLVPTILESVNNDLQNTVFSYIPNTAESAFFGLIGGLQDHLHKIKKEKILKGVSPEELDSILKLTPRIEKIAIKDVKLRTFITQDQDRDDLVGHVYDITYGTIHKGTDNLVIIDDSIVRGTTLKQSIIRILDRLQPKTIIVVSSSPQIRYPDCYGIDMAKLSDFIAFKAAIQLLREHGMESRIQDVYKRCLADKKLPSETEVRNHVTDIYEPFTDEEISAQIARMMKSPGVNSEIRIIYQKVEDLHKACPNDLGDWYFTGDYPTPGGNRVANNSFVNFIENRNERAY